MLASNYRLTGTDNFKKVEKEGSVFQSSNFGLAYIKRNDENPSRFGFVVSTKIAKDAVDRNRLKRVMSESVRMSSIHLEKGFDVVFLAKTSITRVATSEIMREVKEALRTVRILK